MVRTNRRNDCRKAPRRQRLSPVLRALCLAGTLAGCMSEGGYEASCLATLAPENSAACAAPPGDNPARAVARAEVRPALEALAAEPAASLVAKGAADAMRATPEAPPAAKTPAKTPAKAPNRILPIGEAVAAAVLSHPLMGAQAAKLRGSNADLRYAEAGYLPTLSAYVGSGHGTTGTYSNVPSGFDHTNLAGTSRTDVGFTFRQLIFDFGATRLEVERNRALIDAEKLKLADQAEDIAHRTVNAFLNLLEQGELIRLIDETVARQRELAGVVRLSQQGGNATKAELDHIQAKVIEIEALRADIKTAHRTALDEFSRLTGMRPTQVRRPQAKTSIVPASVEQALEAARAGNPSVAALNANGVALGKQMESVKAQRLPKLEVQGEGLNKHYLGQKSFSQGVVDVRAMATLSFKLYDGGLLEAQADRVRANAEANAFKTLDERETVELNLRRFYLTVASSRTKRAAAAQGLSTAQSVKTLYTEQFKAGKRTIFEVLDANTLVFTMQRNRLSGEFEEMRALYGILRNMGKLCDHFAREGGPPPKAPEKAPMKQARIEPLPSPQAAEPVSEPSAPESMGP